MLGNASTRCGLGSFDDGDERSQSCVFFGNRRNDFPAMFPQDLGDLSHGIAV
jgi:hypothetical protein